CRGVWFLFAIGALVACKPPKTDKDKSLGPKSAAPLPLVAAQRTADAPAAASAAGPGPEPSAPPSDSARAQNPATSSELCKRLLGPIQLSFTGAATVRVSEDAGPYQDPAIFFNRDGLARPVSLPRPPPRTETSTKAPPKASGAR